MTDPGSPIWEVKLLEEAVFVVLESMDSGARLLSVLLTGCATLGK